MCLDRPCWPHSNSRLVVRRTRLQTGMYQGPLQCVRETIRTEGLLALYRGCSVPLASLLLKRPLEFCIFEKLQRENPCGLPDSSKGFAHGCAAGITGAFVGCPFNVVKVRVQDYKAQTADHHQGLKSGRSANQQIVRNVVREVFLVERSYFRGLPVALAYTIPSASLYLGTYSRLRELLLPKSEGAGPGGAAVGGGVYKWVAGGLAGATASMCVWSVMMPLDTVRTVIQSEVGSSSTRSPTGAVSQIVRSRGVLGLWSGLTPVIMRSVPSTFVSMGAYETARGWLQSWRADREALEVERL